MGNRKPCLLPDPAQGRPAARPGTGRRRRGDGPARRGRGARVYGAAREQPGRDTGTGPRSRGRPCTRGQQVGRGTGTARLRYGDEPARTAGNGLACAVRDGRPRGAGTAGRPRRGDGPGLAWPRGRNGPLARYGADEPAAVRGRMAGRGTGTAQLRYRDGPPVRLHRRSRTRRSLHRRTGRRHSRPPRQAATTNGTQTPTATRWLHPDRQGVRAPTAARQAVPTAAARVLTAARQAAATDGSGCSRPTTGRTEGR